MRKWMAAILVGILAVAGVGYWGYQQYTARQRMETVLANNYNRAYYNTLDHVQNLEVLLAKSLVAADRQQDDKLFTEIWQQTTAALDNVTQLPVSDVVIGRTAKFLTQMGDFTRRLAENAASGQTLSSEQYASLQELYQQAGDLNNELQKVETQVTKGQINFREMAGRTRTEMAREGRQLANANFQTIDETMHRYPTLIYDGPFSDHLENREPKALGDREIDENTARARALEFVENNPGGNYIAQVTGNVEGNIPAYRVEIVPRQNGEAADRPVVMDISRQGGKVIWSIHPRELGEEKWTVERARSKAKEFLKQRGYENMVSSYYQKHDTVVTFNFVTQKDNVIVYPDMVKVSVALDNGEIVGTDARGYLMGHRQRDIPKPELSEQEARDLVGKGLEIKGKGRLALIPTETYEEKLCWEFQGEMQDNNFLIYINALTGNEERILQLFNTDNGQLTM